MRAMVVGNWGFNSELYIREPIQDDFHDLFGAPPTSGPNTMAPATSMTDTTYLIPTHYGKEDYQGSAHHRCIEFL